jgi:translation elongation factor P/translation initiation factor 5A
MKGDKVTIDKRSYEIVFISEDEVVLSDEKTSTHTNVSKNAL